MAGWWQDVTLACRSLRRDLPFTVVVLLTLALGLGGSAGILGVAQATFFARLPFPDSQRILRLQAALRRPDGSVSRVTIRGREFNVLQEATTGKAGPFASMVGLEDVDVTLTGTGTPERLTVLHTTPGWLATLGVRPVLGRWFSLEEERLGEDSGVAVIAHELWQRRFAGDAGVLGRPMVLDGRSYVVVGVLPPGFRFPYDGEVWIPVTTPPDLSHDYGVFARLAPGFSPPGAEAGLAAAAAAVRQQFADTTEGFSFAQISLLDNLQDGEQRAAAALLGVAGFFLLLVCVNVANLLLARAVTRQREGQIRAALGATRWAQVRRSLAESLLLAAAGTGIGLLAARRAGDWLVLLVPSNISRQLGVAPEVMTWPVLLASAALGLLAASLAGALPALTAAGADADLLIRHGVRAGRSRRERRSMDGFVVVQFALALALLAGAGLMLRNFDGLKRRNLGIDAPHLLSMRISISASRYADPDAKRAFVRRVVGEVEALPGVLAAGITTLNPLGRATWWAPVVAAGQEAESAGASLLVNHRLVTPRLASAMGIPLRSGRLFSDADAADRLPVVLVSERLANRLWPGGDPLGQRVRVNRTGTAWLTVVGVVGDVLDAHSPGDPQETWYLPYDQLASTPAASNVHLMVRTGGDPRAVAGAVERAIRSVDPDLAVYDSSVMDSYYRETLTMERLSAWSVTSLAGFGLLLGALGIYGTLSLSVSERTRELGIRTALGAGRAQVVGLVLGQAARLAAIAVALGAIGGWAVGRLLSSQLSQVDPRDPWTLGGSALLLVMVAGVTAYLPAHRAASLDPMAALRQD